jgi:glycosyltransferase involved in cell wall biosynthesis
MRQAMAMGKPVVANNTGMLAEMIDHGTNGFVFDNNPEELALRLVHLARDEQLRRRMGQAALIKARQDFSLTRQADDIEAFYRRLCPKPLTR